MDRRPPLLVDFTAAAPEMGCAIDYRSMSNAARLLPGRTADDVPPLLGSLFAVCPAAQRFAGRLATATASATRVAADERRMLHKLATMETVREHGLRVLLGWTRALGEGPDYASAAKWNSETRSGNSHAVLAIADQEIFQADPSAWLKMDADDFHRWVKARGGIAGRFLADAMALRDVPSLPGAPSGSLLARHGRHPMLARLTAGSPAIHHAVRLIDLAQLAVTLRGGRSRSGDVRLRRRNGQAIVHVTCSRGTLVHRVQVEEGCVTRYAIISPTDRAFSAHGFGRLWLNAVAALPAGGRDRAARAVLQAIDPCVEYRIEAA